MTNIQQIVDATAKTTVVKISVFSEYPVTKLNNQINNFEIQIDRKLKLINAYYEIRKALVDKESDCGISIITNDVMRMDSIIDVKNFIIGQQESKADYELQKEIEYAGLAGEIESSCVAAGYINTTKHDLIHYQKIKQALSDKILDLRITNSISLSEETQQTLLKEGIL